MVQTGRLWHRLTAAPGAGTGLWLTGALLQSIEGSPGPKPAPSRRDSQLCVTSKTALSNHSRTGCWEVEEQAEGALREPSVVGVGTEGGHTATRGTRPRGAPAAQSPSLSWQLSWQPSWQPSWLRDCNSWQQQLLQPERVWVRIWAGGARSGRSGGWLG